jgi:hypothetical protein
MDFDLGFRNCHLHPGPRSVADNLRLTVATRDVRHFKLVALNGLMSPFDPQRAPALKKYLAAKDLKTAVVARSNFF